MNPFTALVWEIITDCPEFLEQLTAIMKREYKPFLAGEQAFQANAKMLEGHIREELDKWYDWLPDTPINRIGGGLAIEMVDCVDWEHVAQLVQEHILQTNLTILTVPKPSTTP
ncbi:MAG: hypothetical protein ACRDIV_03725 [Ktedonobacteraceae bacterium]